MPIYEFLDEKANEVRTQHFSMADAPRIGEYAVIDGVKCRRLASAGALQDEAVRYPHVNTQLPGKPVIESRSHERRIMKRLGWEYASESDFMPKR